MTTFLHTHHSLFAKTGLMRMIDEDEVDLKEQPEDTRYIKKIIQTLPLLGAADSETGRVVTPWRVIGGAEIHSQTHHLPHYVTPWILS